MSVGQTGTELLMDAMTFFGESEPVSLMIVWTDENGNISMKMNCVNSTGLGLAEYAKHNLLEGIFRTS